tara:strand:+ start:111 stop:290 length:180 start_codon:yes stop_codon:yes gene_type:complete
MQRVQYNEKKIRLLENKHAHFDALIKKESSRLCFDNVKVIELKKKKLLIRDKIFRLQSA